MANESEGFDDPSIAAEAEAFNNRNNPENIDNGNIEKETNQDRLNNISVVYKSLDLDYEALKYAKEDGTFHQLNKEEMDNLYDKIGCLYEDCFDRLPYMTAAADQETIEEGFQIFNEDASELRKMIDEIATRR
jgi:hypothetical protein